MKTTNWDALLASNQTAKRSFWTVSIRSAKAEADDPGLLCPDNGLRRLIRMSALNESIIGIRAKNQLPPKEKRLLAEALFR